MLLHINMTKSTWIAWFFWVLSRLFHLPCEKRHSFLSSRQKFFWQHYPSNLKKKKNLKSCLQRNMSQKRKFDWNNVISFASSVMIKCGKKLSYSESCSSCTENSWGLKFGYSSSVFHFLHMAYEEHAQLCMCNPLHGTIWPRIIWHLLISHL